MCARLWFQNDLASEHWLKHQTPWLGKDFVCMSPVIVLHSFLIDTEFKWFPLTTHRSVVAKPALICGKAARTLWVEQQLSKQPSRVRQAVWCTLLSHFRHIDGRSVMMKIISPQTVWLLFLRLPAAFCVASPWRIVKTDGRDVRSIPLFVLLWEHECANSCFVPVVAHLRSGWALPANVRRRCFKIRIQDESSAFIKDPLPPRPCLRGQPGTANALFVEQV